MICIQNEISRNTPKYFKAAVYKWVPPASFMGPFPTAALKQAVGIGWLGFPVSAPQQLGIMKVQLRVSGRPSLFLMVSLGP
jgi:hypothetical protein